MISYMIFWAILDIFVLTLRGIRAEKFAGSLEATIRYGLDSPRDDVTKTMESFVRRNCAQTPQDSGRMQKAQKEQ